MAGVSRRWWGPWILRISIAVVLGLAAQVVVTAPVFDSVSRWAGSPNVVPALAQGSNPAPSPSGAEPLFPANPGLDPVASPVLSVLENPDFEEAEESEGELNTNWEMDPPAATTLFTNGDFASGDLTGWTVVSGTPSVEARGADWMIGMNNVEVLSSAMAVPSGGASVLFDVEFTGNRRNTVIVTVFSSADGYTSGTQIDSHRCAYCTEWRLSMFDAAPWAGESIKVSIKDGDGSVRLDNLTLADPMEGWDTNELWSFEYGVSDPVVHITQWGTDISEPFTITDDVDELRFEVAGDVEVRVYSGAGFATETSFGRFSPSTLTEVSIPVGQWTGEDVKVRFRSWAYDSQVDNSFEQVNTVPGWDLPDGAYLDDDGNGGEAVNIGGGYLESAPFEVTADSQVVSLRMKATSGSYSDEGATVYVLSGPSFDVVESVETVTAPVDEWVEQRFDLGGYQGETIRLRFAKQYGSSRVQFDDFEVHHLVEGWIVVEAGVAGVDANGSYLSPDAPGAIVQFTSALMTPSPSREYEIIYEIGDGTQSILDVNWVRSDGQSFDEFYEVQSGGVSTGLVRESFRVGAPGETGYLRVHLSGNGKIYSVGANAAREQAAEPYSTDVGLGIDTSSGAFSYGQTDATVATELPAAFTRYYHSQGNIIGDLGRGWAHTFEISVQEHTNTVSVVFPSGREDVYDVCYSCTPDWQPILGRTTAVLDQDAGDWTYTLKNGTVYRFDPDGVLESITDPNGNALTMGYTSGDLTTVADDTGTVLTFTYNVQGRVATVTTAGSATWTYAYDTATDTLTSVTDPESEVRSFTYDGVRLATVVDENSDVVIANTYDSLGRVVSQADDTAAAITVAYDTPGVGATSVTNPESDTAIYHFDHAGRTTDAVDPDGNVVSHLYDSNSNMSHIIDPESNEWEFTYDSSNNLTDIEDPLGNPTTVTYNPQHLPTTVVDALNNTWSYTYDGSGNTLTETNPLSETMTWTYDSSGNRLTETNPLSQTTTWTYDSSGRMLTETNALSQTTTWTYNSDGYLTSETDPLSNTWTFNRDLLGRLTSVVDPNSHTASFIWAPTGQLLVHTDPLNNVTTWAYDSRGLVTERTDPEGGVTAYTYDDNRNVLTVTDPTDHTTTYTYDDNGRLATETDPLSNTTTYTYDAAGQLASVTDPLSRVTSYTYDDAGRLLTQTAPDSAVTTYAYDAAGQLATVTDPLGKVTTYTYDDAGRQLTVTDPTSRTTTYGYDAAGRRTTTTDNASNVWTTGYDAAGRAITTTDPNSHTWTTGYDAAGRRVTSTDPLSNTTTYGYDAAANLTSVTDPLSEVTTYAYDAHDRLTSITRPEGGVTAYTYDDDDRRLTSTDPLNNTTSYGYDDAGRLTSETDPRSNTTAYTYDAAGRRTVMTDALSGTVTWAYDAAGQVTSITDPNSATRTNTYDLAGRLKTATNAAGKTWTYYYNAAGRQTAVDDPRGFTISYGYDDAGRATSTTAPSISITTTYDTAGRRSTLTDTTGTTTWGYDAAGNVTSVAAPSGTVTYSFDDADRRATMTTPESTVTYTYDAASQVTTLVDTLAGTFGFAYDDDGRRTSIVRPNDVDTAAIYNAAGWPTSIVHTDTTTTTDIEAETYTYDAAGNVTSVTDLGAVTVDYTIDALNRLTETDDGTTVSTYTYDAAGNRLTETIGAVTVDYTYNTAGQLTETDDGTTTVTFSYDDAGNTIAAGAVDYTWNWNSQLVEIDDGTITGLDYNGDGDLTEIGSLGLVNDTTAGLPTLVSDTDGDAYLHAGGILAETTTGGTLYTHTDNQNTVDATTNATRTVTAADYTAYGETLTAPSTVHGYTGEPEHTDGLTYLRARHYNPDTGRLLTADTIQPNAAGTQGYNLYTYTANNPTTWTDPSGHATNAQQAFTEGAAAGLAWHLAVLLLRTSITYGYVVAGTGLGPHAGIGLLIGLAFGLLSVGLHCARTDGCPEIFGGLDDAVNDLGGTIEEAAEDAANVARKVGEVAAREGKRAFEQGRRIPAPLDPCRLPGLGLCGGSEDDPEVLYHYTSAEGANGIMACQCVFASSGSTNARHGDGAYFTDLAPTVTTGKTPGQLSYAFYEVPWNAPKVQYWVALDVGQMANRPQWVSSLYGSTFSGGIFLSPSTVPVSVAGAIVGSGPTPF